ncbi:membrane protein insertase YidC [Candidatus Pseudomonas adelgestsugas]|uniref:Membrane protein insertase YidC n=1 Tax=Candidatus Pseudomonas adelgestsugas TaxID=1302376 RepID=A0ABX5RAL8_9PSED|nr:membrane protein insertase YidC [Candidatus Pseudomonas adelgestsugas]QAX82319.1 Membrane protein insertase YidC [Candidatus Pseudomonas adelgestsugas]
MDIKRTILIVSLAIVSYVMVFKWNQEYGQPAMPTHNIATKQTAPVIHDTLLDSGVPMHADVPTVHSKINIPLEASVVTNTDFIHVKTDVLDLTIDLKGGDITQLKLLMYPRRQDDPNIPFQLFDNGIERTYLAQSGLTGANGPDAYITGRPVYSATQQTYQLANGQNQLSIDLKFSQDNINYIKRFIFTRSLYYFKVIHLIDNESDKLWIGNLFAQLKRDNSADVSSNTTTGATTYLGAAMWTSSDPYKKVSMKDIDKSTLKETVQGGWVAWLQHYFVTTWIPNQGEINLIQARKDSQGNYIIGFTGPALTVAPGAKIETSATLYAGPKNQATLKELSPGLDLTVDYGILWFLAQPIFWLLQHIYSIVNNWGFSIIFLTMLIKGIFFPLSAASYKSMARMSAAAPKLAALKEQYGNDRQKMSQAMIKLYKKEKINPLGGCLPILVQMPVFLSLYWVLLESVEMRQAPFILWITDLSIKDPFFILPIIMGATMFIQQRLNPTPPDPIQAKVMKIVPIIFTFFFLWFPAGLVLYWVVNNVLSISQQWYITHKIEAFTKKATD